MQLDAVEAGVLGPPGGDPELLDDSGDFLERAVRRDWHPPVLGQRNALEGDDRGREGDRRRRSYGKKPLFQK